MARVLAWLPACFGLWYFAGPVLLFPAAAILKGLARLALPELVRSVEQVGTEFMFTTSLRPGVVDSASAAIAVEVNGLLYAFGLPMFAALTLAAAAPRRGRTLAIGYAAVVVVVVWGALADFLKNVAITSGPFVAGQAGFSALQREAIAFAYQLGSLILPTVVPAITWVMTHRQWLAEFRIRNTEASS